MAPQAQDQGESGPLPAISVVLVTPDTWATIRRTAACIHAQTILSQIELVIVAPSAQVIDPTVPELDGFHSVRIVPAGSIHSVAKGNAIGAMAATSDIVAFIEEHAFPDVDWAAALVAAHRTPCAAASPVVRNAAPESAVAWADHLVSYGPWMDPSPSGPRDSLCWHNVSYKRRVLLESGEELEARLAAETNLHWHLRTRGETLWLASEARIAHLGFVHLKGALGEALYNGRAFAVSRSANWSFWRRLAYAVGSPLIPVIRLIRLARQLWSHPAQRRGIPASAWSPALLILCAGAVGEFLGYAFGPASGSGDALRYEFHRQRTNRSEWPS